MSINKINTLLAYTNQNFLLMFIALLLGTTSCSSRKKLVLLQDSDKYHNAVVPYSPPTIQRNDILTVQFSALDPKLVEPYNKPKLVNNQLQMQNPEVVGYLVSGDFTITLPVLGDIDVKDKTTDELEAFLKQKMIDENRLTNPTVEVVIQNAKFTILGQVAAQGVYNYQEHNLNIFQALGMAGIDLKGKLYNIKVVRETNGIQTVGSLDVRSNEVINSPFYYIRQNDIIYVEPTAPVVTSQGFISNYNTFISLGSLVLTTIILITTLNR